VVPWIYWGTRIVVVLDLLTDKNLLHL